MGDIFVDTVNLGHQAFLNKLRSIKSHESSFSYWLTNAALNLCVTSKNVKLEGKLKHAVDLVKAVENGFNQMKDVLNNLSEEGQDHVNYCHARFNKICCQRPCTSKPISDEIGVELHSTEDIARKCRDPEFEEKEKDASMRQNRKTSKDFESRQTVSGASSWKPVSRKAGFSRGKPVGTRKSSGLQQQFSARAPRSECQAMSRTEYLLSAIQSFDADAVEKLLKSDFEIEYRHKDHHSVLHTAVSLMNPETLNNVRYKEDSNRYLIPSYDHKALRRIIEALLLSGKFNVNALTDTCETVLHVAVGSCLCKVLCSDDYKDMVNTIIELLLKKKANINAKTTPGSTPLMRASYRGCHHIVKLLIDWRDEHGAGVYLNARNINGETALIKAAICAQFDVIDLLLKHRCLDEFHDNRGFYALHAAIYGSDFISDVSSDFLSLIGALTVEETPSVLKRYADHSMTGNTNYNVWTNTKDIKRTVELLVTHGKANINSKDFGGNAVLDLALKSKLRVSQEIVEQLKEYGATSEHPEYARTILEYTDKQGRTPLHRLSAVLPELTLGEKVEIFPRHIDDSPHKEVFAKMTVAKDHKARTVLHYAVIPTYIDVTLTAEAGPF